MKIDIADAFVYVRAHVSCPAGQTPKFCLSDDDGENEIIIAALDSKLGISKTALLLIRWGMAKNYDEAKKMIDNARCPK